MRKKSGGDSLAGDVDDDAETPFLAGFGHEFGCDELGDRLR